MEKQAQIRPWLKEAWDAVVECLQSGKMPHALLIAGGEGLGKRDFASALGQALLCQTPGALRIACGQCRACRLMKAGTHPDYSNVAVQEEATQIKIDQIRELSEKLSLRPHYQGYQVAVIDPAEAMTLEASNALLKTLEEPSEDSVLVLVSDRPSMLSATIKSRCRKIDARPPRADVALAYLQADGIESAAAFGALSLAAGNPGLAQELAQEKNQVCLAETLDEFRDAMAQRRTMAEVAVAWAKSETERRLLLLSLCARACAWDLHQVKLIDSVRAFTELIGRMPLFEFCRWWDKLNKTRALVRTPLKSDLLIFELLHDFYRLINSNGSR